MSVILKHKREKAEVPRVFFAGECSMEISELENFQYPFQIAFKNTFFREADFF